MAGNSRLSFIASVFVAFAAIGLGGCGKSAPSKAEAKKPVLTERIKAAYPVTEEAAGVWRIDEHGAVSMHLVIGEKKAALIDSGAGTPGLDAVVASLTDLPVIVINTHFHEDHAMGNRAFDTIYAHPADLERVRYQSSPKSAFLPLREGDVVDLGGRKLSVIETPGHTKGSICLLDAKNRMLFTGDNNNGHVWLFLSESLSVQEYLASLERLIARSKEYDLILIGHGDPCDIGRLERIAESCRAIMKGGIESLPYKNYGALSYGPGDALVAYDPNKIFAPR
jgi:hydroxyacylglutathione hydrolase